MKYLIFILSFLNIQTCNESGFRNAMQQPKEFKGLTFVAPPKPFPSNPLPEIQNLGASWTAVVPYAFTFQNKPMVRYEGKGWQWWGETPEGIRQSIRLAHEAKLNVMLKPQIYIPDGWTGNLTFDNSEDWDKWEKDYIQYISIFVKIAEEEKVELFCIGTEFRKSIEKRPLFWKNLIQEIRKQFRGKLTYAANWDEYPVVPFWADLDYIGVNAYFELIDSKTPNKQELMEKWKPIAQQLENISQKNNKPLIFTEYGYLSVDGCAGKGWEVEKKVHSTPINEEAQANALDALWTFFGQKEWWQGGFLWKWFPNNEGHEGYFERDYTPQGKQAATVLKRHFSIKEK